MTLPTVTSVAGGTPSVPVEAYQAIEEAISDGQRLMLVTFGRPGAFPVSTTGSIAARCIGLRRNDSRVPCVASHAGHPLQVSRPRSANRTDCRSNDGGDG